MSDFSVFRLYTFFRFLSFILVPSIFIGAKNDIIGITIIEGTTPTLELTLSDETIDLSTFDHVYATLQKTSIKSRKVTKSDAELTLAANVCSLTLTQEETLLLGEGRCKVQMNWTSDNGAYRDASESGVFTLGENLLKEVLA